MGQAWHDPMAETIARSDTWTARSRTAPTIEPRDFEPLLSRSMVHAVPARPARDGAGLIDEFVLRLIEPDGDKDAFVAWAETAAPDLLALFTPAARRLGDMWIEDECSFCDVTIGMHRLTMLLIDMEADGGAAFRVEASRYALLAPSPGDQHGFGTALVGLFLRRAGWDVTADICGGADEIVAALRERHFDLAGFSIGHERAIEPVAALIRVARRHSRNPDVRLAVGGPMVVGDPDLARRIGADLWAEDAESLVAQLA